MWTPSNLVDAPRQKTVTTGGVFDGATLEQLLDTKRVSKLPKNYNIEEQGRIEKRTGRQLKLTVAGGNPILFEAKVTDTLEVFAYATSLAFWNKNDNTTNVIKSDFAAGITDGERIGNDMYTCNGIYGDVIYKTTLPTLLYDTQTVNFVVGLVITGATSGATATIITDTDAGATGTLVIDNITGTFVTGETITDSGTGSAKANGAVVYTNTATVAAAPKCEELFYFDERLVAGKTNAFDNEVHAAKTNDPATWTVGSNAGDPFKINFKRAGEVTDFGSLDNQGIENQGNYILVGYKDGDITAHTETQDVGGTLTQKVVIDSQRLNAGVESIESTAKGAYICNENGVFFRQTGQNRNSDDINLTRLFGDQLDDFNFVGSKMLFVPEDNRLLVLCKRDGSSNKNAVLVHDTLSTLTKNPSWVRYQGWSLNTISLDGNKVYGGSSLETKLYELFKGTNDTGSPIVTEYEQYLNTNSLENVGDMYAVYCAGKLTFGFDQTVGFDIINEEGGRATPDKSAITFGTSSTNPELAGLGSAGQGYTGMGGTTFSDPSSFTRKWYPIRIYGFSALILKITGSDSQPHQVNWVSVKTAQRREQRKGLATLN